MKACENIFVPNNDVDQIAETIGMLAKKAMLDEVLTTPKPGLVDTCSNGAHNDMTLLTFFRSAFAITPYLAEMARAGALAEQLNENLFFEIRQIGIEAEKAMFTATEGINTHKGMIFSLGIFSTVAAYCMRHQYPFTEDTWPALEKELVASVLMKEIEALQSKECALSNGERLYRQEGIRGIRGEALSAYRSIRLYALPVMQKGIQEKKPYNLVKLQTLFSLMSHVEDSNVVARKGMETLHKVQNQAKMFLNDGGAYQEDAVGQLLEMDVQFIKENISSGGCADLLAVTIFVNDLMNQRGEYDIGRQSLNRRRTGKIKAVS